MRFIQDQVVILDGMHRLAEGIKDYFNNSGDTDERGIIVNQVVFVLIDSLAVFCEDGIFQINT